MRPQVPRLAPQGVALVPMVLYWGVGSEIVENFGQLSGNLGQYACERSVHINMDQLINSFQNINISNPNRQRFRLPSIMTPDPNNPILDVFYGLGRAIETVRDGVGRCGDGTL